MSLREYPTLPTSTAQKIRPITFIVVRFSDDYLHNILRSECVHDPVNQLITIDNRSNLFYDNLGQAINAGLDQAQHEVIAVVHEDVLLPEGWQQQFERSLTKLEKFDPNWGLLGSVGWDEQNNVIGHWSDPHRYLNTFVDRNFEPVKNIDEQLMIMRASSELRFDDCLPSIHNIGRDLFSTLKLRGMVTYAINAPTIHKYADQSGNVIHGAGDSRKISDRRLPSFIADIACSNEYLHEKWPEWRIDTRWGNFEEFDTSLDRFRSDVRERLEQPVVLLSRGGSGSRLLSWLAKDAGIFLGNEVSSAGDSLELVRDLYAGILNKYLHRAVWQKSRIVQKIRLAAAAMLERCEATEPLWGFKLPESMLLVPELDQAFANARYIHLIRDPLTTCLRRTHMTARLDNTIGRVTIREAYRHCGLEREQILEDSSGLHMAYTTIHQIESVREYARNHLGGRYLEIRFEDLLKNPPGSVAEASHWLGVRVQGSKLEREVDPERAAKPSSEYRYPGKVECAVAEAVAPLRRELGYL